ncbi:acidic leucine-rich nuclear phosphoprotein 32-related protein 1 [Dendrobium catenatum]|uniref:Acidic leucine-rich nuclear phosphoprotein 32-related protein 1 n=1 Tax=Dendrobium catenatum TaxID=906689 RepID=A0A2I0WI17_9ASPA|nr:acidic leucine-rich nuclear phosphoprotein 32-related protein 1 [Dendrobium catenatum]XP_020701582.1 acidic leucine-rich nuclear phosphoprotein 32-related protein 1 [Dendrobium catenatum]XP_028552493.1 acidic leucine-rich nuclear phosphoprotein 32-related protein 1 [Dendrobium catenatum]PKU75282.1 Acidic leucine-rich nuclear phosphoprotein 32-related protein 1 [Dendrobium catenatum]
MDEVWERAVEAKLEGQATPSSELRVLNLDGAVKSLHGCLPPAGLLERFPGLEHLSIANVGATSLERFPRLRNLQRLILSDNRIAGGLESLVDAGLQSLRDLDLSNNRIQHIEDLAPLAALHLVSLDLYECPVTRVKDYRSKVFAMIRTLKYLDKLDANENERPESDEEEEEEDEEEYDDDEEDSGSGEVDGGDQTGNLTSGARNSADGDEGIVDADEDEGSDADEEEIETNGRRTGSGSSVGSGHHLSNGFRMTATAAASVEGDEHDGDDDVEDEDDDDDEEEEDDLGEEIDEDEAEYEDDAAEMHNILESDEEDEDGVDEVEIDEEEIDEEDVGDDEEVDEDDDDMGAGDEEDAEPASTGRLASTEGEIDGHDHGEEDENGEIGEEDEQGVEDRGVEEEDYGESEDEDDLDGEYLVQPIARSSWPDSSVANEEDEIDYEDENHRPSHGTLNQSSSSSDANKRNRDEQGHHLDNDKTEERRPSKRR